MNNDIISTGNDFEVQSESTDYRYWKAKYEQLLRLVTTDDEYYITGKQDSQDS